MVRHILLFSFRDEVGEEDRRKLLEDLREFPVSFPQIKTFELGGNESRRDATYQYGMTMLFEDLEGLNAYLNSEQHEHFVENRFRPLISGRAIVSFET